MAFFVRVIFAVVVVINILILLIRIRQEVSIPQRSESRRWHKQTELLQKTTTNIIGKVFSVGTLHIFLVRPLLSE